jgi:hypothetical protein
MTSGSFNEINRMKAEVTDLTSSLKRARE